VALDWTAVDESIERLSTRAFGFLAELVAQPSTVGSESGAQDLMVTELERLGFAVGRQVIPDSVAALPGAGVPQRSYAGRHNVVARRGEGGRPLIVNGHIDVVPADEPQLWSSPPFEPRVDDGWMVGRGAGDMKCGFAMLSLALDALRETAPEAVSGQLTVVSAIEEEYTGNGTLASVADGVLAEAALLVEPTGLDILIGGTGVLWFEIMVVGRSSHAESADRAVNPLEPALHVIAALRSLEADLNAQIDDPLLAEAPHPYNLNIGTVRVGDWQSSVPAVARVGIRLGFPRAWTVEEAQARVRRSVTDSTGSHDWLREHPPTLRFNGFLARGHLLAADQPLVGMVADAHRAAHGRAAQVTFLATTTDARSYLAAGVPAVCYGPRVRNIHGIDEAVELRSIVDGARTLARFLVDWFAQEAGT